MREDCDFFIALGPNLLDPNSVEIYLEGEARGWVAVGFSNDSSMVSKYIVNAACYCMIHSVRDYTIIAIRAAKRMHRHAHKHPCTNLWECARQLTKRKHW